MPSVSPQMEVAIITNYAYLSLMRYRYGFDCFFRIDAGSKEWAAGMLWLFFFQIGIRKRELFFVIKLELTTNQWELNV